MKVKELNVEIVQVDIGINMLGIQKVYLKLKSEEVSTELQFSIGGLPKIFDIAGVHYFHEITGKYIRARIYNDYIINIGHIIKDLWYAGKEEEISNIGKCENMYK